MKSLAVKTFFIIFILCGLCAAAILGYAYFWYNQNTHAASNISKPVQVTIQSGESFATVAENLESQGIIKNAFAFRLWTKLTGEEIIVQAGNHTFSPDMTLKQVADQLSVGIKDIKVLLKEGVRSEEIADVLNENLDKTFNVQEFVTLAKPNEGMLFPDTYIFQKSTTAQAVFDQLHNEFEDKYSQAGGPTNAAEKKRIVILASLLEREGKNDLDRPIIAGIILNRLNKQTETAGFLQIDATLQYALNESKRNTSSWWPIPSAQDREVNSLYNTYKFQGLPPGPICNPGLPALKAAIKPQVNNYLYYIHDNTGKAYYAKNLDEHNSNIAKYLN